MQESRHGAAIAAAVAIALLAACQDDPNRIAGAGIGAGGGSGFQNRTGGFQLTDPSATIALVGDFNGDGAPDYAVGEGAAPAGGRVTVRSGLTHTTFSTVSSPVNPAGFGSAISGAGDVDRDGRRDLLVGAPRVAGGGAAFVISGRDGKVLRQIPSAGGATLRFGSSVLAQDVNGDDTPDHYVSTNGSAPTFGGVSLFDGASGNEITSLLFGSTGSNPTGTGPNGLIALGDYDLDGIRDILVSNDAETSPIVSGKTLRVLRTHPGRSTSATVLGDFDGDSIGEYAIGYPHRNDRRGQVEIFSGATGRQLFVLEGTRATGEFGHSIAYLSDRDGDGVRDFAVGGRGYVRSFSGASRLAIGEQLAGNGDDLVRVTDLNDINGDGEVDFAVIAGQDVIVFSGAKLSLASDRFEISVGSGGIHRLSLDVGPEHAGANYFILGSITGVAPGTDVGNGLRLPINLDAYTNHTLHLLPGEGFVGFGGILDANGRAEARLAERGSLPPGLIGVQLFHAGLVIRNHTSVATTNPVAVTFVR